MPIATKPIVVLYHSGCTDGFSAAWAAWKKLGYEADYFPVRYQTPLPDGLLDREIYFVDFSLPADKLIALKEKNKKVVVIDHHASATEDVKVATEYVFDLDHSGAVLAWHYFHPNQALPRLLSYVEDRDLWNWQLPDTKALTEYIDTVSYDFKEWDKLADGFSDPATLTEYIRLGLVVQREKDKMVARIAETAIPATFQGYKAMVANTSEFVSEVGEYLYAKYPIAIMWHERPDGIKVSLRSDGSVDVSKIATQYGGGGHPAAASFKLPPDSDLPWEKITA